MVYFNDLKEGDLVEYTYSNRIFRHVLRFLGRNTNYYPSFKFMIILSSEPFLVGKIHQYAGVRNKNMNKL